MVLNDQKLQRMIQKGNKKAKKATKNLWNLKKMPKTLKKDFSY